VISAHPPGPEKDRLIRDMFAEIVPRYDLLNRLLTFGMDLRWRRKLASGLHLHPGDRVLDLATGTGDVAAAVLRQWPGCRMVGADPVEGMLARARAKVPEMVPIGGVAEMLPFGDSIFNAVTVAFGVRNFNRLEGGLAEIHRVLRPGGQLAVLEFARPHLGPFQGIYRFYLGKILPVIGGFLSGGAAYQYLPESIDDFPSPGNFMQLLQTSGFSEITSRSWMGGTVWLYRAKRN